MSKSTAVLNLNFNIKSPFIFQIFLNIKKKTRIRFWTKMFWRFSYSTSQIQTLLEKEDVTLEEIMNEEDVLQEGKVSYWIYRSSKECRL